MKITVGNLRRLLAEASKPRKPKYSLLSLIKEEDDSTAHETGASGDSIDSQVDRYLAEYESDSKKVEGSSPEQMESIDWRDLVKGVLINEAGQGDKDASDDADDAAPGAAGLTGEDTDKLGLDKLDVEKFANDIVRLVENYDSLLEIRSCLIRRAMHFLQKTYSDEVVKAFEDTLRDDHGMEAGTDRGEINADRFPAPAADRASGSAQAGVGGGGPPA